MNSSTPDSSREADIVIYLDYGVDCVFGYYSDIRLNEQGLVFRSRWRLDLGTQISLRVCAQPESPETTRFVSTSPGSWSVAIACTADPSHTK